MSDPSGHARRVLVMAAGLTPQVVTETLYALAVDREPPWVPTEVRLITTQEGALRARLTLLDASTGYFHRFCEEYGLSGRIHFDENCIVVLEAAGRMLDDIRTPAENVAAADGITEAVRQWCSDPDAAVHVSIAGGRKTMGYYLGYALSLFGRAQDRLSHVLINEPFESLTDFFYPPRVPRVVYGRDQRPASSADARVTLAEIPFVRLRDGLPAQLLDGSAGFAHTVEAASLRFGPPRLRLIAVGARVQAGETTFSLPPMLWAWYATLAEARQTGLGEEGALRPAEVPWERLVWHHRRVTGSLSKGADELERRCLRDGGLDESFFREKSAKLNRCVEAAMGTSAAPYRVISRGRRPFTRHGIGLPVQSLEMLDDWN
jgi:CRISPR-associated protein (TIGR02584 family)